MTESMATVRGVIQPDAIYHVEEFKSRVRWGAAAFRAARRRGLRTIYAGGRCYVYGSDFVDYLNKLNREYGR